MRTFSVSRSLAIGTVLPFSEVPYGACFTREPLPNAHFLKHTINEEGWAYFINNYGKAPWLNRHLHFLKANEKCRIFHPYPHDSLEFIYDRIEKVDSNYDRPNSSMVAFKNLKLGTCFQIDGCDGWFRKVYLMPDDESAGWRLVSHGAGRYEISASKLRIDDPETICRVFHPKSVFYYE